MLMAVVNPLQVNSPVNIKKINLACSALCYDVMRLSRWALTPTLAFATQDMCKAEV